MENRTLKLLIIEDDPDQRELIREQVEDRFGKGTVTGAESRAAALREDLASFDLILADYNLPDGTGLDVLADVQKQCNTPVIIVTGENVSHIASEAIKRGAVDYVVKFGEYLFTIPVVIEKNLTFARIIREREELRRQLELKNAQLEQMAATDPLTGLHNRRYFSGVLEQMFATAQRHDQDLACVMIDLDHYKKLNDTFGHQVGDELLVCAGRVIAANMRKMDVAARYGGDEFVLLLPHASAQDAGTAAARIREEFRIASAKVLKRDAGVTMSVGIATMRTSAPLSADALVAAADAALYCAKDAGKNRVSVAGKPAELAA